MIIKQVRIYGRTGGLLAGGLGMIAYANPDGQPTKPEWNDPHGGVFSSVAQAKLTDRARGIARGILKDHQNLSIDGREFHDVQVRIVLGGDFDEPV